MHTKSSLLNQIRKKTRVPASGNTIQYCSGCVANESEREKEKEKHRKRIRKEDIKVSLFSNSMFIRITKYSIGAPCVNK